MVEIKQQLVPQSKRKATFGTGNPQTKMVVHQTGNPQKGANAQMHANLQSRGYSASWHIQSDDKEIIQSWPFAYRLYHASTGSRADGGNMVGIAWEICINSDGDYLKSLALAAQGIGQVMRQVGMPMSALTTHNAEDRVKRKWCPAQILSGKEGVNWADFKRMVQLSYDKNIVQTPNKPSVSKPSKSNAQVAKEVFEGKWGNNPKRRNDLQAAGYNYNTIQSLVNDLAKKGTTTSSGSKRKTNQQIAQEVIDGKWGNNPQRKQKITSAGYDYGAVQKLVNQLSKGGTTSKPSASSVNIDSLAQQVVKGIDSKGRKIPNGVTARAKHFGISQGDMSKVQKRVNELIKGKTPSATPSINIESLARQVVKGIDNRGRKIPNGVSARAKHFGISVSDMNKVQKRVNQLI